MKKIISLLILILVISISASANNTPESKRKLLINKIDRNVMAMELMFTKNEIMTKKTLYHRYRVVMMDYRHQLNEVESIERLESIEEDIHNWNSRNLQLLNKDTKSLERELSTVIEVDEIKKIVYKSDF